MKVHEAFTSGAQLIRVCALRRTVAGEGVSRNLMSELHWAMRLWLSDGAIY